MEAIPILRTIFSSMAYGLSKAEGLEVSQDFFVGLHKELWRGDGINMLRSLYYPPIKGVYLQNLIGQQYIKSIL